MDSSLVGVWYERKDFEPMLHADMDFSIWNCICICIELLVYTYTWWQIPHLYDLWNVNKWMNEWMNIVPHNTDHFQVRLGLVLFLVTWRDFVPHNTDHFQVRLDLVLFLVTWRDIVPHNTDHFQVRLGLVLFLVTWRDLTWSNVCYSVLETGSVPLVETSISDEINSVCAFEHTNRSSFQNFLWVPEK